MQDNTDEAVHLRTSFRRNPVLTSFQQLKAADVRSPTEYRPISDDIVAIWQSGCQADVKADQTALTSAMFHLKYLQAYSVDGKAFQTGMAGSMSRLAETFTALGNPSDSRSFELRHVCKRYRPILSPPAANQSARLLSRIRMAHLEIVLKRSPLAPRAGQNGHCVATYEPTAVFSLGSWT